MKPIHVLLTLGAAGVAWLIYRKNQSVNPSLPYSQTAPAQPSQPSQMYPFQASAAPRADNANQPWYNGPSTFMTGPATLGGSMTDFAKAVSAGSSIVHSLSDVWGGLGDIFGSSTNDPESNLVATDDWWESWESTDDLSGGMSANNDWSVEDADWDWYNEWA
jgi:hypothetical protein